MSSRSSPLSWGYSAYSYKNAPNNATKPHSRVEKLSQQHPHSFG